MKCNPWRWIWGLIPIIALGWLAVMLERPRIEADLASRAKQALSRAGYGWATVTFAGRDGLLTGKALDETDPGLALATTAQTWGVRTVDNTTSLIDKIDKFEWAALRRDNRIRLDGLVPSDRTRRDVVGIVKATFPGIEVDDRMSLARGAPALDVWLGGVNFALKQLAILKHGRVDLEKTVLSILGEARDVTGYRAVKAALATGLPQGIRLGNDGVRPPLIKPYIWTAERSPKHLALSGRVPNDKVREDLLARAKHLLPDVDIQDQMAPGDGAPDSFVAVAMLIVQELAKLDEGNGEIKDTTVTLTGLADSAETENTVRSSLKQTLPPSFRASEQIKLRAQAVKTASPYVTALEINSGVLVLSGSAPNERARQAIAASLQTWPGAATLRNSLDIAAGQSPDWQTCFEKGIAALRQLGNGSARMTDRHLMIEGATDNAAVAQRVAADARGPGSADCEVDVRVALNPPAKREEAAPQSVEPDTRRASADEAARRAAAEAERRLAD
jgi:OOP family OmpA-OmpF porin